MKKFVIVLMLLNIYATVSAQTRPHWQDISNRPVIYVSDFGLVGDGVADDSPKVRAAAASLTAGATLLFPPGKNIGMASAVVISTDNIVVDLNGSTITALAKYPDNNALAGAPLVFSKLIFSEYSSFLNNWGVGNLQENVTVLNYKYTGNLDTGTNPATGELKADASIASGAYYALAFIKVKNFNVDGANILNSYASGIAALGCVGDNVIQNSRIKNGFLHGIATGQSNYLGLMGRDRLVVTDCIIENIAGYALDYHQVSTEQETSTTLSNNQITNVTLIIKNQGYLGSSSDSNRLAMHNNNVSLTSVYFDAIGETYTSAIYPSSWVDISITGNTFTGLVNSLLTWNPRTDNTLTISGNIIKSDSAKMMGVASGTTYPAAAPFIAAWATASQTRSLRISQNVFIGGASCIGFLPNKTTSVNVSENVWETTYPNTLGLIRSLGPTDAFVYKGNYTHVATDTRAVGFSQFTSGTVRKSLLVDNTFRFTFNDYPLSQLATDTQMFKGNSILTGNTLIESFVGSIPESFIYEAPIIASYSLP
jgi:hypothetical protein